LSAETIASSTATSETVTSQFNRPQQLEINIATSSLSPESRDNQQVKTGQIIPRLFTRNRALALAGVATVALALAAVTSRPPESSTELPKESAVNNTTDSYTGALERGYIRLGAQAESPPLNYVEDGERKGLDYEILKLIAGQKEFGLTKAGSVSGDINTDEYSDIPLLLNKTDNRGSHTVDIVAGGLTFKDGDIDNVRFTIPYLEGFGYALLTPKNSTIRTLADLKEKRVGVIDGDPDVRAYASRTASKSTLVKLSDADETWITDAFDAGKVDAIIYDFPFASTETQGTSVNIAVANLPGSKIEYRFGVRKSDQILLDKLNSAIRRIKDTNQYSDLLKRLLPTTNVVKPSVDGKSTYTVGAGDSLSQIAAEHLGSPNRWIELQSLNNLPNPNFINPGQVIITPDDFR